ncbi:MAG: glucokinase [Rhodospirillales bacterium]|nr:glucokinase [Rhodospirillales bacterium]MBO6785610.1 glucokinase [Rhodospirillales bacterium]
MSAASGLIADVGGTNARFAHLNENGGFETPLTLACKDFETPAKAIRVYVEQTGLGTLPAHAAFSVAGPVRGGKVDMTNHIWRLDADELATELGFSDVAIVNDFEAVALGIPDLKTDDTAVIRDGAPDAAGPVAVMGAGTGLGVSVLIPSDGKRIALATEGGHATLAPRTDQEAEIVQILAKRFGHVSWERVLSGPGLEALYQATGGETVDAAEVTSRMQAGDETAIRAFDQFFAFLGTAASDVALTCGATGGVYLAGGILPRLEGELKSSGFAGRFVDKGRFGDYLSNVPVKLITHPFPAFVGLRYLIDGTD